MVVIDQRKHVFRVYGKYLHKRSRTMMYEEYIECDGNKQTVIIEPLTLQTVLCQLTLAKKIHNKNVHWRKVDTGRMSQH